MILIVGASGYMGSAFMERALARGMSPCQCTHGDAPDFIETYQKQLSCVINCAAFIPPGSVAQCDAFPEKTIQGNIMLPQRLMRQCQLLCIPFAHLSTACLWGDGQEHGEDDPPQRSILGHCGFYIGAKLLAESLIRKSEQHYIWRIRLPFDHIDHYRNYLSKLASFSEVYDHCNSLSHRFDCADACLQLLERKAPFGTYNVVNPGAIKATEILERLHEHGLLPEPPVVTPGPAGGAIVSCEKMIDAGVKIRHVVEAVESSLANWTNHV